MKAGELMSRSLVSIGPMEPVAAAARLMQRYDLGSLPVCDNAGRLRGMLTDRDIVTRCVAADMRAEDTPVREVMSRGVAACAVDDEVSSAASVMAARQLRRLPVLREGKPVGMLSLGDIARQERCRMECAETLGNIAANVHRG